MPDQNPLSPKIEDLKARVRLDPKSRLFLPLAEELRKSGRPDEAESVLRSGLEHHSTYLSAWISLGRCLIERGERREATSALMNALSIDPGNVVAARLLADNYLALGEKVEAIKKLKLVRALLPADDTVEDAIASLEREIGQATPSATPAPPAPAPEEPAAEEAPPDAMFAGSPPPSEPRPETSGSSESHHVSGEEPAESEMDESGAPERQRAASVPFFMQGGEQEELDQDSAPQATPPEAFAELPRPDDPDATFPFGRADRDEEHSAAQPEGEPEPFEEEAVAGGAESDPSFESASVEQDRPQAAPAPIDEQTSTLTMADLYARQGHVDAARDIYLRILDRDPSNEDVRRKLDLLADRPAAKPAVPAPGRGESVKKLEKWLQKVGPR